MRRKARAEASLRSVIACPQRKLAIDTTVVSTLRGYGSVSSDRARRNEAALTQARRRQEKAYPELCPRFERALLVAATRVGGSWSEEAMQFLHQLPRAKSEECTSSRQTVVASTVEDDPGMFSSPRFLLVAVGAADVSGQCWPDSLSVGSGAAHDERYF